MRLSYISLHLDYSKPPKLTGSATYVIDNRTSLSVPIDEDAAAEILAAIDRAKDRTVSRAIKSLKEEQGLLIEHTPEEQSLSEAIGLGVGGRGVAEY